MGQTRHFYGPSPAGCRQPCPVRWHRRRHLAQHRLVLQGLLPSGWDGWHRVYLGYGQ